MDCLLQPPTSHRTYRLAQLAPSHRGKGNWGQADIEAIHRTRWQRREVSCRHRLVLIVVPDVVPLVSANKASESRRHGAQVP